MPTKNCIDPWPKRRIKRPKVMVIGPLNAIGGIASVMRLQLSSSLARRYELIAFDNSKQTSPNRRVWQGILAQLRLVARLLQVLGRDRPKIVHIHTCSGMSFFRSVADMLLARLYARSAVFLHIHGGRFEQFLAASRSLARKWALGALVSADRVIVLSPCWAERIGAFDRRIRFCVVPNGVILPQRAKRWRGQRTVRIVFVGNLKQTKGIDDLLEAIARLPKKMQLDVVVAIIGGDPQNRCSSLKARLQHLKVKANVEFLGELADEQVRAHLRKAELFVLPSYIEGLPVALLEAMACGLPAVASDVGAVPEVIVDAQDGFVVRPGDLPQLARVIKKLISDPQLRRKIGQAGRRKIRSEFSQQKFAQRLADLYREVLGRPRKVSP